MTNSPAITRNLPFSFAKRYGVFLQYDTEQSPVLCHQPAITPHVYAEVRRFLQAPFSCQQMNEQEFDDSLAAAYR